MNLDQKFKLHAGTALPDDWELLEIHLHDAMMDVKFYQPYTDNYIWVHNAHSLQTAFSRFEATPKHKIEKGR